MIDLVKDVSASTLRFILESWRLSAAVVLVTGFLLFARQDILSFFKIDTLTPSQGETVGYLFLAAAVLLVLQIGSAIVRNGPSRLRVHRMEQRRRMRIRSFLTHLTNGEKRILHQFLQRDVRALELPVESEDVKELVREEVLKYGYVVDLDFNSPYQIDPWVREYLKANPQLLAFS